MKKKLILIMAVVLATCMILLTGCNDDLITPNKISEKVTVTSGNGSFLLETDSYLYFVNGTGTYSDDNTFGAATKSSLVRIAKSDLGDNEKVEVVLPKIMICSSSETGVFISGNDVYYATPNTEKSKAGDILVDQVSFSRYDMSTGKNSVIKTISAFVDYKYTEVNGKVYLVYTVEEEDEESEDEDATKKLIKVLDAQAEDKEVYTTEHSYTEVMLGGVDDNVVYYTAVAYNEELESDESFYELYSYTLGDEAEVKILDGKSSFDGKTSTQGYEFSLVKYEDGVLIGTQTGLDSTYTTTRYFAYNGGFADLGYDNTSKASAITSSSIIRKGANYSADKTDIDFYYISSEKLICYNTKENENEYIFADCSGYTLTNITKGYAYLYYENTFYRIFIGEKVMYRLNDFALSTSVTKFMPVVVTINGTEYLFGIGAEDYSYSYVYYTKLEDLAEYDADEVEVTEETVTAYNKTLVGIITDDDQESFDDYIEDTYSDEDEDED